MSKYLGNLGLWRGCLWSPSESDGEWVGAPIQVITEECLSPCPQTRDAAEEEEDPVPGALALDLVSILYFT